MPYPAEVRVGGKIMVATVNRKKAGKLKNVFPLFSVYHSLA